jgi:hypothetical protein
MNTTYSIYNGLGQPASFIINSRHSIRLPKIHKWLIIRDSSSDFLIKVDSINVPKSVNSETPFDIEFFGTIGFDGCTEFKTFNQIYDNNDITIEAWGTYNNQTKCPTVMVSLDGQKLNLTIYSRGVYTILIREPDSFSIVRQITVN